MMLVDVKLACSISDMLDYALRVGMPLLSTVTLLAWLVTRYIRKTVANPIDAIAGAAQSYVQDRRAGTTVADHFSPLNINSISDAPCRFHGLCPNILPTAG